MEIQVGAFGFIALDYVVNGNNYGTVVTMVRLVHILNVNTSIFITL